MDRDLGAGHGGPVDVEAEVGWMSMRAAVIGFGVTGESVVRHLRGRGVDVVVLDTRASRQTQFDDVSFMWECQRWPGLSVDFAVVSPGLSLEHCLVAGAAAAGVTLCSDIDLFFDAVTAPVLGVTGTNGKSTVVSLAGHLLNSAGLSCGMGGNLGVAALDLLAPEHQCYVLELSSFQLERSKQQPFQAAAVLNLTEDHLDRHGDMQRYAAAKHRIYHHAERCIYNRQDPLTQPQDAERVVSFGLDQPPSTQDWGVVESRSGAATSERALTRGTQVLCMTQALPLTGAHNELNVLAACALVDEHLSFTQIRAGLGAFTGLPHRFETVAEVDGAIYINDSKATNLGATMAALAGMPCTDQVILIAGGDAKGVDLSPLADVLRGRVREVLTIGRDGPALGAVADQTGVAHRACDSLADAVRAAHQVAQAGDSVLLSPACASLDMFDNYMQRGEQFAAAVRSLTANASDAGLT